MIKDLKLAINIWKFAPNKKSTIISGLLFIALGGFLLFWSQDNYTNILGLLMICVAPTLLTQIFMYVNYTELIASSGKKKSLFTKAWIEILLLCHGISYLLGFVCINIATNIGHFTDCQIGLIYIILGLITGSILCYNTLCYKFFYVSMLLYLGVFFYLIWTTSSILTLGKDTLLIADGVGVFIGIAIILGFAAIGYLMLIIFYKKPLDRKALGSFMKADF